MIIFILLSFVFSPFARAEHYTFPADFKWCVATAGHQVEGDNVNSDWWAWEQLPGKIRNGDKSGKAAHHMERMEEDVRWMKQLGVTMYRFSIEWSRIEPKQGQFDEAAIAYYRRELDLLKKNGITPFVTLHHFVQPKWFTDMGGWNRDDAPEIFMHYVTKVEAAFGPDIGDWVTFNEPTVLLIGGFVIGVMPPGEHLGNVWMATVHLLQAHAKAYHYLHAQADSRGQKIRVGMANHIRPLVSGYWIFNKGVEYADRLTNWSLPLAVKTGELEGIKKIWGFIPWPAKIKIDGLSGTQDFLGINYYTREYIKLNLIPPFLHRDPLPGLIGTDLLNWGIDPEGFYYVLQKAHENFPEVPFMITENGINDPPDRYRADFVRAHLAQLHRAMTTLPHQVLGYCHWTLMDNFEWIEGFTPRFGILEVDYKTGDRKMRPSGKVIEKIFKSNQLDYP